MADVQISVIQEENTQITLAVPGHQGAGGAPGVGVPAGGTSGQVLEKASNTDYDTQWVDAATNNITGVTAGTGLSGGGTSGNVTLNLNASIDALTDVDTTTTPPTDGQALAWDNANSEWIPMDMAGTADLGYISGSSSGEVTSSTGTNATIPGFTSTNAGLAGASGGGTDNFLRADGTWNNPPGTTNLTYTTAATTGTINSSTGTDATIPKFTTTDAGLVHGSGGGTANFLRADGSWSIPPGSTNLSYTASSTDGTVNSDSGNNATIPLVTGTDAGLMAPGDKTKLDGIAAGAEVNVDTDLSYTASTRELASSTGNNTTLPLFDTASTDAGLTPGSNSAGATSYLDGTGSWSAPVGTTNLGYTAAPSQGTVTSDTGTDATVPVFDSTNAGLVGGSGGGTTNFLRADGTWTTPAGGVAGSDTQVQFNDNGSPGGDTGLTFDKTTNELTVGVSNADPGTATVKGDLNLDSGGNFSTTIQSVTPTANRTISFPDQTGTVGLVSGATGNIQYNNAGQLAGTGGLNTELDWVSPTGTYTALKVNADSNGGNTGTLLDLQVDGTTAAYFTSNSNLFINNSGSIGEIRYTLFSQRMGFEFSAAQRSTSIYAWGAKRAEFSNFAPNCRLLGEVGIGANDLIVARDDADTLAQRRSTNAQTFRLYNTWGNNGVDFERLSFNWDTNVFKIKSEAGGTGTVRGIQLGSAATEPVALFGATPVVQPTTAVGSATVAGGGGTAVDDATTFAPLRSPTPAPLTA
ncbi:MAG: hypothetical protein EBV86_08820 [Marivivens sp.]|nr:hypothetical protein [Marivivens sp.]